MGDNDFPATMGNTPIGFVQQYMRGDNTYAQQGDSIPDYATKTQYQQEEGGPLVAQTSLKTRLGNFLNMFNDLDAFKKEEESNQKIKDMARERNRQREIDDLNKKLRMDQGYGGM